ncbi:Anaphase-promoting complex subunit 2 [Gryganskiella cystojenkinii]|nr:Anaphase-promoting complex subunit 2 [Gryganskiella cystojenkinii]
MSKFPGWGVAIEAMTDSKLKSTSISIQQLSSSEQPYELFFVTTKDRGAGNGFLYQDQQQVPKDKENISEDWMIETFEGLIQEIDDQIRSALQMTEFFDAEIQIARADESLEVTSRLVSILSGQLLNALPVSFNSIAFLYFRSIFRRHRHLISSTSSDERMSIHGQESSLQNDQRGQVSAGRSISGKEPQGRILQNGRKVRDLYEPEAETETQAFHLGDDNNNNIKGMDDENSKQLEVFRKVCSKLQHIGIATQMAEVATNVVNREIEKLIFELFARNWSVPTLEQGQQWMNQVAVPFLRSTILPMESRGECDHGMRKLFCLQASRLEYYFYKCFGDLRIQEYVDIVLASPESEPAVLDLQNCLEWTGQQDQLLQTILSEVSNRIAQPGAGTQQIIDFYIFNIKYLRILDPSGSLLDQTNRVLNRHLRSRPETMRCIVEAIVDESGDLLNQPPEGIPSTIDPEDDSESWVPEPAHAGPDLSTARRRMTDIISVLVSIYKSNDLFIEEFQNHLSTRLLQATDFNVDREIQQLELLKLRFKENELHHCEVMLADIASSKRINGIIAEAKPTLPVQAAVVSRYYWPEIEETNFSLPYLDRYMSGFQDSKPAQRLTLLPSRGLVDLELEIRGQTVEFQVSPLSASIIAQFENEPRSKAVASLSLSEIATQLQATDSEVETELRFWVDQGILREMEHQRYCLTNS